MNATELMLQLSNPTTIATMPFGDKLLAALVTTALGMGITFSALILLMLLISRMERVAYFGRSAPKTIVSTPPPPKVPVTKEEDDVQLTAVITAVLAHHLHTSTENIVVRNIVKTEDSTPAWGRVGILEQINGRL